MTNTEIIIENMDEYLNVLLNIGSQIHNQQANQNGT